MIDDPEDRERKRLQTREAQRAWRKRRNRIDFYAEADVQAIVNAQRVAGVGGDASSILNRIVREWAASGISCPIRARTRGTPG
jgi:hypothetical protein